MIKNDTRANEVLDAILDDLKKRFKHGEQVVTKTGVERIDPSAATIKATVELLEKLGVFEMEAPAAATDLVDSLPFKEPTY